MGRDVDHVPDARSFAKIDSRYRVLERHAFVRADDCLLMGVIGRRLLEYLRRHDDAGYRKVLEALSLRK